MSPANNAYSETFIQGHRELPYEISFYYDGYLPSRLETVGSLHVLGFAQRLARKLNKKLSPTEYGLWYSLRRRKIKAVLAEYGPTAAESLPVIRLLKLPLVVHFHGYDASVTDVLNKYAGAYREVFDYAHAVVVVSREMRAAIIKAGCPVKKIFLAVYGPAETFFKVKSNYASQQFVAVGRFVEKKAPLLTLRAFEKVWRVQPRATLVMIGEGLLLEECQQYVQQKNMQTAVTFAGIQSPEEVQAIFKKSIAFIQHSITAGNGDKEGTPVAILEAQASGLAVVSTIHAGIPDLVIDRVTGFLVKEKDVEGMANAMMKILNEPGLAEQMGQAGRTRVWNEYRHETYLTKLTQLIDERLAGKTRQLN